MIPLSPAAQALGWTNNATGDLLRTQAQDETEELKKKREAAARQAGYSPAGSALAGMGIDFGVMSVPGAS